MIDGEKMRHLVKVALFANVIVFVAWIATLSIARYTKNQLIECQILRTVEKESER